MKKAYTITLTTITILCIVFGTAYHTGLFFKSFPALPFFNVNSGIGSNNISINEEYDGITSAALDLDLMNVTIVTTDSDKVELSYEGKEKLQPIVTAENGVLTLTQQKNINLGLTDIKPKEGTAKLILSFPKTTELKDLSINVDMGDTEIKDLNMYSMELEADMGNIDGSGLTVNDADIDCNMGNVALKLKTVKNLKISSDMGNVDIDSDTDLSAYSTSCSADMGNIEINGSKVSNDFEREGSGGRIDIDSDLGNITLKYQTN